MDKTTYVLPTIINNSYLEVLDYILLKDNINQIGFLKVNAENLIIKVYNPILALIFTTKEFPVQTRTKPPIDTVIDGSEFHNSFIEGYKKGIEYFNENFKISPSILYGENLIQYVGSIQNLYENSLTVAGYGNIKTSIPYFFSNKISYNYGYYSGIISEIEELKKIHPTIFTKGYEIGILKKTEIVGYDTNLTDDQIKELHSLMEIEFINGQYEHFKAIFRPTTRLDNFEKVKWLTHKTSLREFFSLLEITPTQKKLKDLISDKKGTEIILPKRKRNEYSKYYSKLENIIKQIKKRP